ncbi:MAG TPA: SBBP repeat-containing protein [Bryobacteraceae bacterium]|nr:SBBP repeat-containing protein [Bryobacteraceae bacterium]
MSRPLGLFRGFVAIAYLMPVLSGAAKAATSTNVSLPVVFEPGVVPGEFTGRAAGRVAHIAGDEISFNGMALRFSGTQTSPWNPEVALPGHSSYMIGPKSSWRTVQQYGTLHRNGIYSGVDLVMHGSAAGMEYDFVVAPRAATDPIRFALNSAREVTIEPNGSLVARSENGDLRLKAPVAYQNIAGQRREIEVHFAMRGSKEVGFKLGPYDTKLPLIIDPVLEYMSVLGGVATDIATAVTTDSAGDVYVTGTTGSKNFPRTSTALPSGVNLLNDDAFVTKMDPRGLTILYSVYFGGTANDMPSGIQVDAAGEVYLTGVTSSSDFPVTSGAYNLVSSGPNSCFATKLNATGTAFVYSALLGPCASAAAIAIDSTGDAYVTGDPETGFPTTPGAFNRTALGAFALKLNPQGTALVYSTLLPGSRANALAIDSTGTVYVAGQTISGGGFVTTPEAAQIVPGGATDAFVLRLSADGSGLLYSTLLGGPGFDAANAIAVDPSGAVYLTGSTSSSSSIGPSAFPVTPGVAFQTPKQNSGFLAKLNPSATQFPFSTYLDSQSTRGGGEAVALDGSGNVYVAENTSQTTSFAENTEYPAVSMAGINILKFNTTGTSLLQSAFFPLPNLGNPTAFWFENKGLASERVGDPVETPATSSIQALYVVGSQQQPGVAISNSDRVFGPGGLVDASIMKVDMNLESSDEFQVDATYLLYNSQLGSNFNYLPSTKTISLTSSGAPLPFHIVTPRTITVSQTDGTTPAQVALTYTPTQSNIADPLLIVIPGAKEGYKLLAVANGGGLPAWSVPSTVQIPANPSTGIGAATFTASVVIPNEFGSTPQSVPFSIQLGGAPSWLQVIPTSGTTPATITLTGNANGFNNVQSASINLLSGSIFQSITVSLVPNAAPANLTVTPQLLQFNFPSGANAPQSQQITIGSTGVPLSFTFGTAPTGIIFTPNSGSTPGTVTVTADPTRLPSGFDNKIALLSVPGTGTTAVLNFDTTVGSTLIAVNQINDITAPDIALGALVDITGWFDTDGKTITAPGVPWPTTLGGFQVKFNNVPIPLESVSPRSIRAQMPYVLGSANVTIEDPSGNTGILPVRLVSSNLTAFPNPAVAYKLDGSTVSPTNPVAPGDTVVLEFTGQGKIFPPVAPGTVPVPGQKAFLSQSIAATIGGKAAVIQSTAMSATMPGVLVVNVQVPDLHSDAYLVQLSSGSVVSTPVPIVVQK